ncbi:tRNA (adenosine(37)-N6)-threonylcarbamoyltransferase complex dimerization subunit type 1 TsaB [Pseudostreptobacillus hongkongensis]|uniref:tRNA (adenosine(37)-N6)-threonylcarbamoyltransferase complex dimerization subunit type 1 TsaB n=1 Tax=Pseudostreptobacillus hongkongensis TaxID=1162717 RepID=UPI0028D594F1|nr:tRNA (adenosine(37)-N6)-threonylcarbamoyltransferase complex dimerization subunit type 1 TsaB [Pseudostreptobacillus hongkongensis]
MKSLFITTSTKLASISLYDDKGMLANINVNVKKTHSTCLIDQISSLFDWTSSDISEIENVIVSVGPGSFTGVRIALSAIKGMFVNSDVNVYSVNELDALGYQGYMIYRKDVLAIIDSNKEKIYYGYYRKGIRVGKLKVSKLNDVLKEYENQDVGFMGDGAINYSDKIIELGYTLDLSDTFLRLNSTIFNDMYKNNMLEKVDLFNLVPEYLEKSQAEKEKDGNK